MSGLCITCPHSDRCCVPDILARSDIALDELDDGTRDVGSASGFPYADGVRFRIEVEGCVHHPKDDGSCVDELWDDLCDDVAGEHDYDEGPFAHPKVKAFEKELAAHLKDGEGREALKAELERLLKEIAA